MTTRVAYPPALAPNVWDPSPALPDHRFALGHLATTPSLSGPLFVLGMNPSHANDRTSDTTVNRVIEASILLGYSGWLMLNLYPERASSPVNLRSFDQKLSDENCSTIKGFIEAYKVREIFGAWGNPPNATIRKARPAVLQAVATTGARIFYFGNLTAKREPRHLNPRRGKLDLSAPKRYL